MTRGVIVKMFEGCCVPVVLYGSEAWRLNAKMRRRVEIFEIRASRAVCGMGRRDRITNVMIREVCEWRKEF